MDKNISLYWKKLLQIIKTESDEFVLNTDGDWNKYTIIHSDIRKFQKQKGRTV